MYTNIQKSTNKLIMLIANNNGLLAAARQNAHITDSKAQVLWPILFDNIDERDLSRNGEPTYVEIAIYTAIHLFAIYHKSNTQLESTDKPVELFASAKTMQTINNLDLRIQELLRATNINNVIMDLTRIVKLLKSNGRTQPIAFASLAYDLYVFQLGYTQANQVKLKWGQVYFRHIYNNDQSSKEK